MSSPPSNPETTAAEPDPARQGLSRRKLFGAAGVTAAVVGAAGAGALAGRASAASADFGGLDQAVPFRGNRQAGIITPQQDRMHFAAFDVTTDDRDEVVAMLKQWTAMAERMTQGHDAVPDGVVFIPFAFVEAAANLLTNPALDPFGKIPEFKYCAAKLEAVGSGPRMAAEGAAAGL